MTTPAAALNNSNSTPGMLETIRNRALSVLLFSPGPFYFYPPKAGINSAFGSDYDTSYYHFRQNHRNAVNLALHAVCFFVQIFGNFALLNEIDTQFPRLQGYRIMSISSAISWSFIQLTSTAPKHISIASSLCILGAYLAAPSITPRLMDHFSFGGFLMTLVLSNMATGIVKMKDMVKAFGILTPIFALSSYIEDETPYFKSKAESSTQIMMVVMAYLAALPLLLRNPLKPLVISSVFVCRAAYILTGQPILFYLGYAFLASLFQGVTHNVSREEATLVALERKGDTAKISFEYGHVTYFPSLAVNSVYDWMTGAKLPTRPSNLKEE